MPATIFVTINDDTANGIAVDGSEIEPAAASQ